jgi:hypothetical protein
VLRGTPHLVHLSLHKCPGVKNFRDCILLQVRRRHRNRIVAACGPLALPWILRRPLDGLRAGVTDQQAPTAGQRTSSDCACVRIGRPSQPLAPSP